MTDKEKAWAYDGALNRAKMAIDFAADKDLVKGVVTAIFPQLREDQENDVIDIPFGANDSELKRWEYTIPEGFTAEIKGGKVIVREKESEDERIRKSLVDYFGRYNPKDKWDEEFSFKEVLAYLEKQKDASKAIEAVDRIYKYTEVENVANAHDMNDSNPNKKYYCGWNDALGKIAGILQDVYFNEKQKEQKPTNSEKSKEWSEEDEEKITFLERLIRYNVPEGQYGWVDGHRGGFVTKLEAIFMLKSLRPSWKPSKEQMKALRSVLEHEAERVGSSKYLEKANFLYEQLEKLI